MNFKRPKNTDKYFWTRHSIGKMMQYGLSGQRVIRVIRAPKKIIEGVAKNTIAVMQPSSVRKNSSGEDIWSQEIWAMYQIGKNKGLNIKSFGKINIKTNNYQIKIISAWRYPGVSSQKSGLPEEILSEMSEAGIEV